MDQSHEIPTASFYFTPEDQAAERNLTVSFLMESLKPVRDRSVWFSLILPGWMKSGLGMSGEGRSRVRW